MLLRQRSRRGHASFQCLLVATGRDASETPRVCAGWGNDHLVEAELKMLQAHPPETLPTTTTTSTSTSPINSALAVAFTLLGRFRLQKGVDTCGAGRQPWTTDPSAVFLLTDGIAHAQPDAKVSNSILSNMLTQYLPFSHVLSQFSSGSVAFSAKAR